MACFEPATASDATAILEVVDDGITGILCTIKNADTFVKVCQKIAADQDMCRKMGEIGRKCAVKIFSEVLIIKQYIDFYKSLLKS